MDISKEYKMQCLARYILNTFHSKAARKQYFDDWEKRHGKTSRDELRRYVVSENNKIKAQQKRKRIEQFGTSQEKYELKLADIARDTELQKTLFGGNAA